MQLKDALTAAKNAAKKAEAERDDAEVPWGAERDAGVPWGAEGDAGVPWGADRDAEVPWGAEGDAGVHCCRVGCTAGGDGLLTDWHCPQARAAMGGPQSPDVKAANEVTLLLARPPTCLPTETCCNAPLYVCT